MPRPPTLLYLIADGGTARFVERVAETGAYVTRKTLDGRAHLAELHEEARAEGPGRSMESANSARHAVGREDVRERAKADFARHAAAAVKQEIAARPCDGIVLAAPSRLLSVFRAQFDDGCPVVRSIAKDLTKTPDHELGRWLDQP